MIQDFDKQFFIRSWGPDGYYEHFNYGVGIEKVMQICLYPFLSYHKIVLEIGSGGGVFTEQICKRSLLTNCIDVIQKPKKFDSFERLHYIEIEDKDFSCKWVPSDQIDFAFSYNVFCHFSNDAIRQYLQSVQRVLRPGGDFVFMLSSYGRASGQELGTLLPMGHFAQDERTLPLVMGEGWEVISPNMIPEHRDIIVHLKKAYV